MQIESTYSSLVLLAHQFFGEELRTQHVYGCMEIIHRLSREMADTSVLLTLGSIIGISALYVPRILRTSGRDRPQPHGAGVHDGAVGRVH